MRYPRLLLIGTIRLYQLYISPIFGPRCNFYPTCSQYGVEALQTHGIIKGMLLLIWRLLRCNPWNLAGVDHVPCKGRWRCPPWIPPDDWELLDLEVAPVMGLPGPSDF